MHVHTSISRIYVHLRICIGPTFPCSYICMSIHMCTCMHTPHAQICLGFIYIYMYRYTHTHIHTLICIYTHMYACMYVSGCLCARPCACASTMTVYSDRVCARSLSFSLLHTHTHTHTHSPPLSLSLFLCSMATTRNKIWAHAAY